MLRSKTGIKKSTDKILWILKGFETKTEVVYVMDIPKNAEVFMGREREYMKYQILQVILLRKMQ